nr:PREDICTED: uncharacterized protein LOC105663775 [Megachile rotundata]
MQQVLSLFLFLLGIQGQAPPEDNSYAVSHITDDAPIYLEHLSKIRMYHETWRIIAFIEISELDNKKEVLTSHVIRLKQLCIRHNTVCRAEKIITYLGVKINRIRKQQEQIDRLIGRANFRRKRGIFNPIGEVSKILFGTLSSADAEYYNTEIDKLHDDIGTIARLVKNQTHIMKTQILDNLENVRAFKSKLTAIDINNEKLYNVSARNKYEIELEELALELTNIVNDYSEDVNNLMNAIADSKHGIIHPQLLSPDVLFNALRKTNLPEDTLPIPLEITSFTTLIDISEITMAYIKNRLVYILHIPLLETQMYNAYRVIPIPHKKAPETFYFYDPPDEYIILNTIQTTFSTTDNESLNRCKRSNKFHICKRQTPDYSVTHKDACLTNLLHYRT